MKKKNIIISSFITIALCISIIAGSTFALFTSQSKVNIAITSGEVSVVAGVDENSVETKQLYDTTYEAGSDNMYEGVATFSDEGLTLEKFVPGDGIKFNIVVKNESTVSVKYRTIISCENDNGLFDGLVVNIGENNLYDGERHVARWEELAVDAQDAIIPVSIELPETAGSEYQGKSCVISYAVEAVQGNAYTGPNAIITRYEQADLPVRNPIKGNLGGISFPTTVPDEITVEAAWTFKATDTDVTVQESPYKDWICDFVIECDGNVELGELGLWGAYGGMDFAFANPLALPEGQTLFMLTSVGFSFTYADICTSVVEFDCGVFRGLAGDKMEEKKITVSLCLINPEYVMNELVPNVVDRPIYSINDLTMEDILELMKKENWKDAIGTNVLIANQTSYYFG